MKYQVIMHDFPSWLFVISSSSDPHPIFSEKKSNRCSHLNSLSRALLTHITLGTDSSVGDTCEVRRSWALRGRMATAVGFPKPVTVIH